MLVAAATSAVIIAFLIPLGLLLRAQAEDRAIAGAGQEAHGVAALVARVSADRRLRDLVRGVDQGSPRATSVVLPDGTLVGTPPPHANAQTVSRARAGQVFTLLGQEGAQVVVPVVTSRGTYVVRTAVSSGELHEGVTSAWLTFVALGMGLMALALVGADWLGCRVSAPVSDLASVAVRLRTGELDARALPRGPPETVELGSALNLLADRIGELLVAEREALADLSHRLRTPLTALRLDVESITEPEVAERLHDHVSRLVHTVDAVVKDARRPVRHALGGSCDAASVVRERVAFWSVLAIDQGRELTVSIPSAAVPVATDMADLVDVVDALVDNVFSHTPDGTAFAVSLTQESPVTRIHPALVRLEVADCGPGPATADFATRGRSTANSTGLGLDIVRRAAIAAGGGLVVAASPSGGMLAAITLGVARGPAHELKHVRGGVLQ